MKNQDLRLKKTFKIVAWIWAIIDICEEKEITMKKLSTITNQHKTLKYTIWEKDS